MTPPAPARGRGAMEDFCRRMPKVELHAHLHGSVRMETVASLLEGRARRAGSEEAAAELRGRAAELRRITSALGELSLDECFVVFACVHAAVRRRADVERLTREVLEDFEADNVRYLELRTTPRPLEDASKAEYVAAVERSIAAFAAARAGGRGMAVRLILSVDRTASVEEAADTLALARSSAAVVGLDFSGNPTRGRPFQAFRHLFEAARAAGLGTTVHVAEVDAPDETAAVIAFGPDRVGHACVLNARNLRALHASAIPIEVCPTSNLKTLGLADLSEHPTLRLWTSSHPHAFSINTVRWFGRGPGGSRPPPIRGGPPRKTRGHRSPPPRGARRTTRACSRPRPRASSRSSPRPSGDPSRMSPRLCSRRSATRSSRTRGSGTRSTRRCARRCARSCWSSVRRGPRATRLDVIRSDCGAPP